MRIQQEADRPKVRTFIQTQPEAEKLHDGAKEAAASERVSSWAIERLGTALSTGDNALTLGVALKLAQLATDAKLP